MRGNSAILKCLIPSFVADFVYVLAWINEDEEEFLPQKEFSESKDYLSHQNNSAYILEILFIYYFEN